MISVYIGNYLRDEILAEARIRNISTFLRFLEVAAFSNGEMVNYSNIASECGAPTIKEYFQILEDTLTGRFLPSFQKRPKRRVILAPKFYFFDVEIVNYLQKREGLNKEVKWLAMRSNNLFIRKWLPTATIQEFNIHCIIGAPHRKSK